MNDHKLLDLVFSEDADMQGRHFAADRLAERLKIGIVKKDSLAMLKTGLSFRRLNGNGDKSLSEKLKMISQLVDLRTGNGIPSSGKRSWAPARPDFSPTASWKRETARLQRQKW